MNMKPFLSTLDPKTVINKNSEISDVILESIFFGDHRGNVYIKKFNMNHLSPRTQSKTYLFK